MHESCRRCWSDHLQHKRTCDQCSRQCVNIGEGKHGCPLAMHNFTALAYRLGCHWTGRRLHLGSTFRVHLVWEQDSHAQLEVQQRGTLSQ